MPDVICVGELLVEFVAQVNNVSLEDAPGFIKAPGGAPANVAVALQRLGLSAGFVGKVGDDPFGRFLRRALDLEGVDTRHLMVDSYARTTAVFVTVWDDGRKDLCFYRNPGADAALQPAEVSGAIFDGARAFHYGSITLIEEPAASAQRKLIALAQQRGLLISYDPNYRPTLWPSVAQARAVIREAFQYAHLVKISWEEWEVATGCTDLQQGIRAVLDQGVQLLVVSRGADGAVVANRDFCIEVPAFPIEVVETTGAGDAFMAAMILHLLPEWEKNGSLRHVSQEQVRAALRFACAAGALTCTRLGAIPALPTLAETQSFFAQNGAT